MVTQRRLAALAETAGYGAADALVVGIRQANTAPTYLTSERTTASTVVYTASLSKQITAACAASAAPPPWPT